MDSPAAAFAPIPPHSTEAERSVLGAMLQNGNAVSTALEILVKDDFYVPAHQAIFEAAKALSDQHSAIDLVTMNAELSKRGTLPGVGGIEYLIELTQFVPTTANVKDYIRIVAEKSTLRRLITASGEISQASYAQEQDLPQVLAMAEKTAPMSRWKNWPASRAGSAACPRASTAWTTCSPACTAAN